MGSHFAGIGTQEPALVNGKIHLSLTGLAEGIGAAPTGLGAEPGRVALDPADFLAEKPVDAKPDPNKTPLFGRCAGPLHLNINEIP